jgi:hypothetical protein
MNLESLANELLFNLFQYFNITHLFRAFYGLNNRLNKLLFVHMQFHSHLSFESISKTDFDIICQDYLPTLIDRIISLRFSDDDETPEQINYFLSYGFQFHQFTHLKSLSLSHICSDQIMNNIIIDLQQLHHLTHLKIDKCQVDHDLINDGWIFDQIWSLSTLTHCHFERKKYLWNPFFISPKTISSTIKYLFLEGFLYNSNELHQLLEHTINLEHLRIDVDHNYDYGQISSVISSIKKFQIFIHYSPYITNNLLQYMTNLTHLTIELAHVVLDGFQWETIIENYLPNLKIFHFKMEYSLRENNEKEKEIELLLNSFRSQFWINKHQWYIQCHWYSSCKSLKAYFYTLPYYFEDFIINDDIQFRSTCPNNQIQWIYDHVHNLSFNNSICHTVRFPDLYNLKLHIPCNDYFWSVVPKFDRLTLLTVKSSNYAIGQSQLENLLKQTTSLYSLTLTEGLFSNEVLFNLRSPSIRRLHLYGFGCFNDEQCSSLTRSSVGIQCEVLCITVKDRVDVLNLVSRMNKLRALNVRCQNDKWKKENDDSSSTEDELVQWLQGCLPKTCVITRGNTNNIFFIQIWIQ